MKIEDILDKKNSEEILAHVTSSQKVIKENNTGFVFMLAILLSVPAAVAYIGVGFDDIFSFFQVYLVISLILIVPYLPWFIKPLMRKPTDYYVTNLRFIECHNKKYKYATINEISKVKTNVTVYENPKEKYNIYEIHFYEKYEDKYLKKLSFVNLEEKDKLMSLILSLKEFKQ